MREIRNEHSLTTALTSYTDTLTHKGEYGVPSLIP